MAFSRSDWRVYMAHMDRASEGGRALFWRHDPIWERLHGQRSWGRLLEAMSLLEKIEIDCRYTATSRSYHAELFLWEEVKRERYSRTFYSEGYGAHPLSAVLAAVQRLSRPLRLQTRLRLLQAFVDYLADEMHYEARG